MLILVGPYQVATDEPISVVEFVRSQLASFAGQMVDGDDWVALADEVWKSPANEHLRHGPRDTAVAGSTSPADRLLVGDEWIYLPQVPQAPYELQTTSVEAGQDAATAVLADAAQRSLCIPGDRITNDQLEDVAFNAALRNATSSAKMRVYYYSVPVVSTVVDAVPTAGSSPLINSALANPPWLPTLWHWLGQLHQAHATHRAAVQDLQDIKGAAQITIALLTKLYAFLDVYQRYEGVDGQIGAFQGQVKALRGAVENDVASDGAPLPQQQTVVDAWKAIQAIVQNKDFQTAYDEFCLVRQRYPATSHAFDLATATWLLAGVHTPGDSAAMEQIAIDTVSSLSPADGSVTGKHLAATLHDMNAFAKNAAGVFTGLVSNTPGPSTVSVAILKVVAFAKLAKGEPFQDVADTTNKIFLWVAAAQKFKAQSISELAAMFQANPAGAAALRAKTREWDLWCNVQKGKQWLTGTVGVLDVFMLINALADVRKDWAATDRSNVATYFVVGQDVGAAGITLGGSVGSAAQLLQGIKDAGNWSKFTAALEPVKTFAGRVIAVGALVAALFDLCDALSKRGDRTKWADFSGNLLIGMQRFLPIVISRFFPALARSAGASIARLAIGLGARTAAAEAAAFAGAEVGGALVGAEFIASLLSGVGGAVLIGVMLYRNRKAIADAVMSRPGRLCLNWLQQIESTKQYNVGPSSVRTAMGSCKAAFENTHFYSLNGTLPGLQDALAKAGLDEADIRGIVDMPDQAMYGAMGG